jgi:hypothetical protein
MDQLHWDTLGHEHDACDDALFSQAQQLIRQCPCRRYQDSASRCVRCKLLLAMFAHRPEIQDDLPGERKSRLEIVSSRASARSDHLAVRAAPSVQLRDEVVADRSDVDDDVEDPAYERRWEEELNCRRWRDTVARRNKLAKTSDPGDVEDEHLDTIGSPNFGSPALQLVWGRLMSHHQRISQGQNMTNLRRAALITFGPSYGRGTAHAIGLWVNSNDTSIFFKFGCWIRRQREIWFGLLFGSWTTI